ASHGAGAPATGAGVRRWRGVPPRLPGPRPRARASAAASPRKPQARAGLRRSRQGPPPPPPAGILPRVLEQHLYRTRSVLLATGEERGAPFLEREAMGEDRRHVDPPPRHQV